MEKIEMTEDDLLNEGAMTIGDAIRFSGVGRSSLYAAMVRGELRFLKVGSRRLLPKRALVEWLRRGLVNAA